MATNLHIDEKLLAEAQKLSGYSTKRETVNEALAEYVSRRKQKELLNLFGSVEFEKNYDHKKARRSR